MNDQHFMGLALEQARLAQLGGDVPVGCVLVKDDELVGQGFNHREQQQDSTAHAEMLAIREASRALGSWRLLGVTAYVTLEPCAMCAGALVLARVARVVYGCDDPKTGAIKSLFTIGSDKRLNHTFEITPDVRGEECSQLISAFFADIRRRKLERG